MSKIRRIHSMLIKRQISAAELTKAYIQYSVACNDLLNAYITPCYETALNNALKIDNKIANGKELPVLDGIVYSLKDNICTKGVRTTCASKMLSDFVPPYSASVHESLLHSTLIGKTNMDEFGMGSTTENSYFGRAKNPFDLQCVPGGSSGGSAAAVAADMCVFSVASDTGGSVRQPAGLCGVVGFKPTYGLLSRYGLIAFASSLDTVGIIAQSAEDCNIVFKHLCKYDPKDSTSVRLSSDMTECKKEIKIGVFTGNGIHVNDNVRKALHIAVKTFEDCKIAVETIDIKGIVNSPGIYYIVSSAEAASNLGRFDGLRYGYCNNNYKNFDDMVIRNRTEAFGREVKRRILLGNFVLRCDSYDNYYKKATLLRNSLEKEVCDLFQEYDFILSPVTCHSSYKANEFENDVTGMYASDYYTVFANLCGIPAISVPTHLTEDGKPVSVQLTSGKFKDDKLLKMAELLENHLSLRLNPKIGGDCLGI